MTTIVKQHWKTLMLAILFTSAAALFAVIVQFLKGSVLDHALVENRSQAISFGARLGVGIILEIAAYYLFDLFRGKFTLDCTKTLRTDFFESLLNRKYPDFLKKNQGDYLAQYTNQMDLIQNNYFSNIPSLAEILIKILLVSISLFILDYRIALITLVLLTTPLYVPKLIEKRLRKAQKTSVESFEKHLGNIVDWLNGFEVIKNYSIEKVVKEKFELSNVHVRDVNYAMRKLSYLARTISTCLSYFSHFIILVFAAYLVMIGDFTAGNFFVAISMIDQLSYPILALSSFLEELISVKPVIEEMKAFTSYQPKDTGKVQLDPTAPMSIVFKDVNFSFDESKLILQGFNLLIEGERHTLLQGPSGSGKSTSMNLLLDYFEPKSGSVEINHTPVSQVTNLNALITIMRQDALLFDDTLRNNPSMYQPITDQEMMDMLQKVGLEDWANTQGLELRIHEGGTNFSGGEKRRIVLARSLLRKTPILILDEPLSNLDEGNVIKIEDEILGIKDRTIILISHYFSKTKLDQFDQVIVF